MCAARNGSLEVTASGTAPYCAEMHQVCSLLRWEGRCWLHPSLRVKVKSGSNMPGTDAERKARTINTGSKACKKACKLFAVQVVFQRKCKQDAWSLALRFDSCHTGPISLGWSSKAFHSSFRGQYKWKPSGTNGVSTALRKPCVTALPVGFNWLLILTCSFLES